MVQPLRMAFAVVRHLCASGRSLGACLRAVLLAMVMAMAALGSSGAMAQVLAEPQPVVLDDRHPSNDLWPQVRIWADENHDTGIAQILRNPPPFEMPATAARTLGMRKDAIWLRIPFAVSMHSSGIWVLDLQYPAINQVDMYLVSNGQVLAQDRAGNLVPARERSIRSRTLSFGLTLTPGTDYVVYLRVRTGGSFILPITLSTPAEFLHNALAEQMLQGVLLGLGLCLLVYSLAQWATLREPLFAKYALLISGSILFCLLQFGVGAQFVWPGNPWIELHIGGVSALIAATGSFLFVEQVLAGKDMGPFMSRVMKAGACLTLLSAMAYALDLISVLQVTLIVGVLGLAPSLLGLPGALKRVRRGDPVGYAFLLAWAVYFVSTWITIEVIKGRMDANFWTLHAFQFGATLDMLIFMRLMGLQTHTYKVAAQVARLERDSLHSMAHTDPLTGLPNRRILDAAFSGAIAARKADELVAVYMLDLDGFKQVNDQYGHDTGDTLLIEVARRLKASLRSSDVVSRMGGDEFLVLSSGLKNPALVHELGEKLVKAMHEPFLASGHTCQVGLTVGYGIAPTDGLDMHSLLKKADAAMYAGKLSGKGRVTGPADSGRVMPA
jgi:diguanylate cyclase (GGDEF)-like protein